MCDQAAAIGLCRADAFPRCLIHPGKERESTLSVYQQSCGVGQSLLLWTKTCRTSESRLALAPGTETYLTQTRALATAHLLRSICWLHLLLVLALFALRSSFAETAIRIPMRADHWLSNGNATFTTNDQAPDGVLEISKGSVDSKNLRFENGSIEFDMYMPDHGILGVRLRTQNRENAEALYFRPQKDCSTSSDCMQYMPLEHGAFEWDLFPEYQTAAPIRNSRWNHFRIVVLGRTLRVYVNRSRRPTLSVDHMEGDARSGGLTLGGPAKYANLVITPMKPSSTTSKPTPKPRDGFLRQWQISTPSTLSTIRDPKLDVPMGVQPRYASMPRNSRAWRSVRAETNGVVNFSHEIGSARDGSVISLAWAKTTLASVKPQQKTAQIGWVREIWVYVNGTLVFAGRNIDGLPAAQAADERISLKNGTFLLPLKKGNNEIAIALDDNLPGNTQHYGWGMEVKLTDTSGLLPVVRRQDFPCSFDQQKRRATRGKPTRKCPSTPGVTK